VPILTIKELMCHSPSKVTMRHAHLAPSKLQTAVLVLAQVPRGRIAESSHAANQDMV